MRAETRESHSSPRRAIPQTSRLSSALVRSRLTSRTAWHVSGCVRVDLCRVYCVSRRVSCNATRPGSRVDGRGAEISSTDYFTACQWLNENNQYSKVSSL